jgi:hypothetical protein
LLRIFTGEKVKINELSQFEGEKRLADALSEHATKHEFVGSRQFYRQNDPEYGNSLWRISDPNVSVGFYNFCFRKNDSRYTSSEKLILQLKGMHFVGDPANDDFVDIQSGGHHIIMMRVDDAFGAVGYGMKMAMKSRGLSDAELVEKCRGADVRQLTKDVTYQMILTDQGACMVFNNQDGDRAKKITVDIEGSNNLRIDGGDTFLKKTITVQPMNRGNVIMKLLN